MGVFQGSVCHQPIMEWKYSIQYTLSFLGVAVENVSLRSFSVKNSYRSDLNHFCFIFILKWFCADFKSSCAISGFSGSSGPHSGILGRGGGEWVSQSSGFLCLSCDFFWRGG